MLLPITRTVILIFFLSGIYPTLYGQQYHFKSYSVADGLPQSQVFAICQDNRGYLWFGTGGGLCRFDGNSFQTFSIHSGLSNTSIRALFEDSKQNLWIGTYGGGVIKYDGKKFKSYTVLDGLNNNIVRVIYEDSGGNIWFGTDGGGAAKLGDDDKFITYSSLNGLTSGRVWSIAEDKDGAIWLGTLGGGAHKVNGKEIISVPVPEKYPAGNIWSIYKDHDNNLLFCTDDGIFSYNGKEFIAFQTVNYLPNNMIRTVLRDKEGNLWIGSNGDGLLRVGENTTPLHFNSSNGLNNNIILALIQDREGNIWVGTNGGGVSKHSHNAFVGYTEKEGLVNNNIWSVLEDKSGNFWFSSNSQGVSRFDGRNFLNFSEKNGLPNNRIWCAKEDSEGNIWFGTDAGLSKYDKKIFLNFTVKDGLAHNTVLSVFQDNQKNIWAGTYGGGASRYDGKSFQNYYQGNGLVNNKVWCIFQDKEGKFWFGTDGGISVFDGKSFKNYTSKDGLSNNIILSIVEDTQKNIWLGSYGGGIVRCRNVSGKISFEPITTKEGLPEDLILSLQLQSDTVLWIGTYKGLVRFNISKFLKSNEKEFQFFGIDEGFTGLECNLNASFLDSKGNLWFGTTNGVMKYNGEKPVNKNSVESQTHITKYRIFLKDTSIEQGAALSYNLNHLTFDFVGLCYTNPLKVQYRHILHGFDSDWSPPSGETSATYSNLPPGKYEFNVISSNNENVWNSTPATFYFEITPPFWKTMWFLSLSIVTVCLSMFLLVRLRLRSLQRAKKILEKIVQERTHEIIHQKDIIEEKNNDIIRSIKYAKRIQEAILPPENLIKDCLPESFIFFKPKDIVSGDFYWVASVEKSENKKILFAAVDCTGHGVPGAFMSIVGNDALNRAVNELALTKPSEILDYLNISINKTLRQTYEESNIKDGMDISLCCIERYADNSRQPSEIKTYLQFAGAFNPAWIANVHSKKFTEIPGNKHPIGAFMGEELKPFTNNKIELNSGDVIYIFSDGYADQFGGPKGKKFKSLKLKELLVSIAQQPMHEQLKILNKNHNDWKGNLEQVDDICVIGVRI